MSDSSRYADYFKRAGTPIRRRPDREEHEIRVHAVFNLIGVLAGAGAAYLAWDRAGSVALAIFAFFAANYFVGRGLGDLVTDDRKVKRFFFFALPVVIDSCLIYLTQQWWDMMWLSVLVGVVVGAAVWALVAVTAFADIQSEEQADTKKRMAGSTGS
jgi:Na+/melibiose symporter-like transporter